MHHLKFQLSLLNLNLKPKLIILCFLVASCAVGLLALLGGIASNSLGGAGVIVAAATFVPVNDNVIFPFHSSIQNIAITPNSSKLYVADRFNNAVLVIDLSTNQIIATVAVGGRDIPFNIDITPDNSKVYVVNQKGVIPSPDQGPEPPGTVSVIDTATDTIVGEPIDVGLRPAGIAILNNSKAYVANSIAFAVDPVSGENNEVNSTVTVIDVVTDKVIKHVDVGMRPIFIAIAITPEDGTKAYVANSGSDDQPDTVSVINTSTDAVIGDPIAVGDKPIYIAITRDGTKAYVANSGSDTVSVINTSTDAVIGNQIPVGDGPSAIVIARDGSMAFVTNSGGNTISVIDTTTDEIIDTVPVGPNPSGIAITEDDSKVYVANSGTDLNPGNTVSVIEVETNEGGSITFNVNTISEGITKTVEASPTALGIARSRVYAASVYRIDVINIEQDEVITHIDTGKPGPTKIAITHDGSRAYVANSGMDTVSVINVSTDELIATVEVGSTPVDIDITPDDSKVYVVNSGLQRLGGNSVSIIDTSMNEVISTVELKCKSNTDEVECRPNRIVITPDGTKVYVTNPGPNEQKLSSNTVSVIDVDKSITDPQNAVTEVNVISRPISIATTLDSSKVYVGNDSTGVIDGSISVIQNNTANPLMEFTAIVGGPIGIAILNNSKTYVTSFFEGRVYVIDVSTDQQVNSSPVELGLSLRPVDIEITPNGSNVYVANAGSFSSPGNTVSVIDAATDTVVGNEVVVGSRPIDIAITPDSSKVFVTNFFDDTVSVIRVSDNQVIAIVDVGVAPIGIAITGTKAYVANSGSNTVSVINTLTNEVIKTINVNPVPSI